MMSEGNDVIIMGTPRPTVGVGYIIIPNDITRDQYLKIIKRTGYCQIATDTNEVINNVLIPLHLIDQISVPLIPGDYGSMISWMSIYKTGQVILNGIHLKPGEMHFLGEGRVTNQYNLDSQTITQAFDPSTGNYSLNVNVKDGNVGSITFNIKGNKITISSDGQVRVDSENKVVLVTENELNIQIGTENGKISTFKLYDATLNYTDYNGNHLIIDATKASLEAPTIEIGNNATEPAILGTQLFNILNELLIALETLTVNAAGTPSPLMPTSITQLSQIQAKLNNILSTKVTTK